MHIRRCITKHVAVLAIPSLNYVFIQYQLCSLRVIQESQWNRPQMADKLSLQCFSNPFYATAPHNMFQNLFCSQQPISIKQAKVRNKHKRSRAAAPVPVGMPLVAEQFVGMPTPKARISIFNLEFLSHGYVWESHICHARIILLVSS
jgi:hypothetical protein